MTRKIAMLFFVVLLMFSLAGTVLAEGGGDCADAPSVEPVDEMPVMDIDLDTGVIEADPNVEQVLPEVYDAPELDYVEQPVGEDVTAHSSGSEPVADSGSESPEQCPQLPESVTADDILDQPEPVFEENVSDGEGDLALGDDTVPVEETEETILPPASYADPYYILGGVKYGFFYDAAPLDFNGVVVLENQEGFAIQAAINHIGDNNINPAGGLLYVETYASSYDGFIINAVSGDAGYLFPHLATALRGVVGVTLAGENAYGDDRPRIDGDIFILGVERGFTLSGLIVDGQVVFEDCAGQLNLTNLDVHGDGHGIIIAGKEPHQHSHRGNVVFNGVCANDNEGIGAYINNTMSGNIIINSSTFDGNNSERIDPDSNYGLYVATNGTITLNGISASGNIGNGLVAWGFSRLTISNAVLNGNNALGNGESYAGWGLNAYTDRPAVVTLDTVFANGNGGKGIEVETGGNVILRNIQANDNDIDGAYIYNATGTGTVSITGSKFNRNAEAGLTVFSSRAITLSSVQASENESAHGAYLNNTIGFSWSSTLEDWVERLGSGNIIVTSRAADGFSGANRFGHNDGWGLVVFTNGTITVTNTSAFENGEDGMWLQNGTGNVTINTNIPGWNNHINGNIGSGITLVTSGNVVIRNTSASNNGAYGLWNYHENEDPDDPESPIDFIVSARTVSITRGWFDGNGDNGLMVFSTGNIALTDVHASHNGWKSGWSGAVLINGTSDWFDPVVFPGGTGTVVIRSTEADKWCHFDGNGGAGLIVLSNRAITVTNAHAAHNGYNGFLLENSSAPSAAAVTMTRVNANHNNGYGIEIHSKGAITLTDVQADRNGKVGALLDNDTGTANVTIRSSNRDHWNRFNDNGEDGVIIYSRGVVSLANINAEHNGIREYEYIGTGNDTQTEFWLSWDHFDTDSLMVYFFIDGEWQLQDSEDYNVSDDDGWSVNFDSAPGADIEIWAEYVVSYGRGISIDNSDAPSARAVTINRGNFYNNVGEGLWIAASGAVTLTDVRAGWNEGFGAYIESNAGNVVVRSSHRDHFYHFEWNGVDGLAIHSRGSVRIDNANFNDNANTGLFINNTGSARPGAVNLNRVDSWANGMVGIHIDASGAVTMVDVQARDNGEYGLLVNSSAGNVVLRASRRNMMLNFSHNGRSGIDIYSNGAVTVSNVNANWNRGEDWSEGFPPDKDENAGYGLVINNTGAGTRGAVSITNSRFESNQNSGLKIDTLSNVTLNRVASINNSMKRVFMGLNPDDITFFERLNWDSDGDWYYFRNTEDNTQYVFTLTTDRFDSSLRLYRWDEAQEEFVQDDESWTAYNDLEIDMFGAEIDVNLDSNGYALWVTTPWEWGTSGSYTLQINDGNEGIIIPFHGAEIYAGSGNVTVTGTRTYFCEFSGNNASGLHIITTGNVTITNTHAFDNGSMNEHGVGIRVGGWDSSEEEWVVARSVTIQNNSRDETSWLGNNSNYGIHINAAGPVTVRGPVVANNNHIGVLIYAGSAVTLRDIVADHNTGGNVWVEGEGNITLHNIQANGSRGGDGVYLSNEGSGGNITITGNNEVCGNEYYGMQIYTSGAVSISGVLAEDNGDFGIYVESNGINRNMNFRNITAFHNGATGVFASFWGDGYGTITATNVKSFFNGEDGIYLDSNDRLIRIINSVFLSNERDGINKVGPISIDSRTISVGNGRYDINYDEVPS